jgi:cytoskeletal protein RodZ
MIGRNFWRAKATEAVEAKGFDAFELRLGDLMRGERATLGKSLLDVQRELKIKAAYIAAIENSDPTAFDTPGFIAGYVRSYARYLNMDPDWAFETFCRESGFATAHGMSAAASSVKLTKQERIAEASLGRDIFMSSTTPFIPQGDSVLSGFEPRAIGSIAILVALIGGLGYGGWSVLQEVQRVEFAPIETAPTVVAEVDPLAGATRALTDMPGDTTMAAVPSAEALDRLYRPEALDVPVLVNRDGPIATINPDRVALLGAGGNTATAPASAEDTAIDPLAAVVAEALVVPQVTAGPVPELQLVAVRPAWVRVRAADGSVLFEGILDAGQTFDVPATEEPATLRVGESGALYFAVNGVPHGPAGLSGTVTSDVALAAATITQTYAVADLTRDQALADYVAFAQAPQAAPVDPTAEAPLE